MHLLQTTWSRRQSLLDIWRKSHCYRPSCSCGTNHLEIQLVITGHEHYRRFLNWIDNNLLTEVISKLTAVTNKEELFVDVKIKDSPSYSKNEIVEFMILWEGSKIRTSGEQVLTCSRICLERFYSMMRIPKGHRDLGKSTELQWQHFQSKGEWSRSMHRELSKPGRRPVKLSTGFLTGLKCKKGLYGGGSRDALPSRNRMVAPKHKSRKLGKPKLSWNWT